MTKLQFVFINKSKHNLEKTKKLIEHIRNKYISRYICNTIN